MEVGADPNSFLVLDSLGIAVEDSSLYTTSRRQLHPHLRRVIDGLGELSAKAQSLGAVITTGSKFLAQSDNKLYFKTIGHRVVGFLKTGYRNLFYTSSFGRIVEMRPLCVLDFYIHESVQRSGYGKELFERMLRDEGTAPCKLAIDRPSPKLVSFMRKHYHLSSYVPQNNNFVIYNDYFESALPARPRPLPAATAYQPTRDKPASRQVSGQHLSTAVQEALTPGQEAYQTSSSLYGLGTDRAWQ